VSLCIRMYRFGLGYRDPYRIAMKCPPTLPL
jgi:hypothetical protein